MAKVRCNNHRCLYNKKAYEEEKYSECTEAVLVFLNHHGECENAVYDDADKEDENGNKI